MSTTDIGRHNDCTFLVFLFAQINPLSICYTMCRIRSKLIYARSRQLIRIATIIDEMSPHSRIRVSIQGQKNHAYSYSVDGFQQPTFDLIYNAESCVLVCPCYLMRCDLPEWLVIQCASSFYVLRRIDSHLLMRNSWKYCVPLHSRWWWQSASGCAWDQSPTHIMMTQSVYTQEHSCRISKYAHSFDISID